MSAANVYRRRHRPFIQYFVDVWAGIATTCAGMKVTLTYLFSKPFTMEYPEVRPMIPPGHRGLHVYTEGKCIACTMCQKLCPVDCIHIDLLGRGKNALVLRFDIDYARCLFCNLCAEACPTSCVELTEKYDLACGSRTGCVLHFAKPKTDEEIAAQKALLEKKEAERKAKREAPKTS